MSPTERWYASAMGVMAGRYRNEEKGEKKVAKTVMTMMYTLTPFGNTECGFRCSGGAAGASSPFLPLLSLPSFADADGSLEPSAGFVLL